MAISAGRAVVCIKHKANKLDRKNKKNRFFRTKEVCLVLEKPHMGDTA